MPIYYPDFTRERGDQLLRFLLQGDHCILQATLGDQSVELDWNQALADELEECSDERPANIADVLDVLSTEFDQQPEKPVVHIEITDPETNTTLRIVADPSDVLAALCAGATF